MNTEELKTFIFLSKVKNFTLAAEKMSIAQSTVTNRISELEKEVGKRLFSRGSKTVKLTEEGKIFLKYAERIIELQETSVEEMNAVSAYSSKSPKSSKRSIPSNPLGVAVSSSISFSTSLFPSSEIISSMSIVTFLRSFSTSFSIPTLSCSS